MVQATSSTLAKTYLFRISMCLWIKFATPPPNLVKKSYALTLVLV
jgi:hypothetical protein